MKFIITMVMSLFAAAPAYAQGNISFSFNIGRQPVWGPTGYDHVEYYYLPDIEVYYYVPQRRFFYFEGDRWMSGLYLPERYHSVDLYASYKIVLNERTPYRNHGVYRGQYLSYRGRHGQPSIRDSRDPKYFLNEHHPEHGRWMQQRRDNDDGAEQGRHLKRGRK